MQECDLLHLCLQVLLTTGAGEAVAEGKVIVAQAAAAAALGPVWVLSVLPGQLVGLIVPD